MDRSSHDQTVRPQREEMTTQCFQKDHLSVFFSLMMYLVPMRSMYLVPIKIHEILQPVIKQTTQPANENSLGISLPMTPRGKLM